MFIPSQIQATSCRELSIGGRAMSTHPSRSSFELDVWLDNVLDLDLVSRFSHEDQQS